MKSREFPHLAGRRECLAFAHTVARTVFALIRATISSWIEGGGAMSLPDIFDQAARVTQLTKVSSNDICH
jgi:hypothetical protein